MPIPASWHAFHPRHSYVLAISSWARCGVEGSHFTRVKCKGGRCERAALIELCRSVLGANRPIAKMLLTEPMDLLTNAVESIQVGVEDYQSGTRPRLLSAVRNIHSGILLLYKEALRRESPVDSNDVLLMAKNLPSRDSNGNVVIVGVGRKTVDTQQIKERFQGLGIGTDWGRFERINEVRNDVEHLYPRLDQRALAGLISDSFLIVRDFISDELKDDPLKLLGEQTWQAMLEVSTVYQKEKQECVNLIESSNWRSETLKEGVVQLSCDTCGSDLLKPIEDAHHEIALQCSSCGEVESPESYAERAVASALYTDAYIAAKDGGETPFVQCPECGKEAYVMEERRCAFCGAEAEHTCARCGNEIPAEELFLSPYCGYCEHMMNKDD
jgi:ribosomal protein L37E